MNSSTLRIRLILAALFALGLSGLIAIAALKVVQPHIMLDAILPERILNEATTEERMYIAEKLRSSFTLDPAFSMLGTGIVTILSGIGLFFAFKLKANKTLHPTAGNAPV